MLSVELRVDVIGMPHAFLVITGPDGVERGYGLAPYVEGQAEGAGWIHDDTEHEWDELNGSETFRLPS